MKSYATLIRLHKFRVDERQRVLSRLAAARRQLEEEVERLDRQLEDEKSGAASVEGGAALYAAFAGGVKARRGELEKSIAGLDGEAAAAQAALQEAYRELKKYEHLEALKVAEQKRQAKRREAAEMDEIASRQSAARGRAT
ncbi:MAG: flagellar export protein FliJ [Pseudomonadota bacterium]